MSVSQDTPGSTAPEPSHTYMRPCTPVFKYINEVELDGTPCSPFDMCEDQLVEEIMGCGVPLLEIALLMARGYQKGNPVALMSKMLGVAACDAPTASVMTTIGSRPIPLNLMVCLVGVSGMGKGITLDAPITTANPMSGFRVTTPASGESLISAFFDTVPTADGRGNDTVRHSEPVWANWGEIDQLAAKSGNANSTLDATLRSLWTGENAGDESITRKKSGFGCIVEGGTYRFVMYVGAQPDHAGVLLEDATGGTLQRLLWFPLYDDDALELSGEIQAHRRRLEAALGLPKYRLRDAPSTLAVWGPRAGISVSQAILDTLTQDRGRLLKRLETVDPLDTHQNNLRLRLAAIFAGWVAGIGNPAVVNEAAWYWAGCVVAYSKVVRKECVDAAEAKKSTEANKAGRTDAERFMAREDAILDTERAQVEDLAEKVILYVQRNGRVTKVDLSRRVVNKRTRKYLDKAIDTAVVSGDVSEVIDGRAKVYMYTGKHVS